MEGDIDFIVDFVLVLLFVFLVCLIVYVWEGFGVGLWFFRCGGWVCLGGGIWVYMGVVFF